MLGCRPRSSVHDGVDLIEPGLAVRQPEPTQSASRGPRWTPQRSWRAAAVARQPDGSSHLRSGEHACGIRIVVDPSDRPPRPFVIRGARYDDVVCALARHIAGPTGDQISDCPFCGALDEDRADSIEYPVAADDQFIAWVSRGALAEGHLLVIPRRHILNLQQLNDVEKRSLPRFLGPLKALLTQHYGLICAFEHGPVRAGSPAGCSIDHAHLHLLPWRGSLVAVAERGYPSFPWRRISGIGEALDSYSVCPYLFVQDDDGTSSLAIDPAIPSQALRRTIAFATGRGEEWDWKAHPNTTTVLRTIDRLRVNTT